MDCQSSASPRSSRFYSADLGRFLSPDSVVPGAGNPSASGGLNRYSYVLNNPMTYTDPSGHYPIGIECDRGCPMHPEHPGFLEWVGANDPEWLRNMPDWTGDAGKKIEAVWHATQQGVYDYLMANGLSDYAAKCTAWGDCSEYRWYELGGCEASQMCNPIWSMEGWGQPSCSLNAQTYEGCDYQVDPGEAAGECGKALWIFVGEEAVTTGLSFGFGKAVQGARAAGVLGQTTYRLLESGRLAFDVGSTLGSVSDVVISCR